MSDWWNDIPPKWPITPISEMRCNLVSCDKIGAHVSSVHGDERGNVYWVGYCCVDHMIDCEPDASPPFARSKGNKKGRPKGAPFCREDKKSPG